MRRHRPSLEAALTADVAAVSAVDGQLRVSRGPHLLFRDGRILRSRVPSTKRRALNARLRVVVYVTREQPGTGADELLVFDLRDEPEFANVVPGGRLEPGETVEEAAVRELREETGLKVRVVRELGVEEQPSWRVPGLLDENHFVHAVPNTPTREEWDHADGAIRCRWIPLATETSVFGEHGAFLYAIL